MNEYIVYAVFGIFCLIVLAISYLRDLANSKKFNRYDRVLDTLIRENYEMKKMISKMPKNEIDLSAFSSTVDFKIKNAIKEQVEPIMEIIQNLEYANKEFQSDQRDRLFGLEEMKRSFNKISPPDFGEEENRIIELYKKGKKVDEIARELRIGIGRINMILKIHKVV